ncbi:PPPDE putative peptidase domain-containing protein [Mycena albidolilacea]|uniref:PPPDE putative peptidase domain-containing protein n=1 Tax=Mycena albidolilacea TaxID=1033008 RepID=A0AAD7ARN4_9AGAR|nr:PPPDE putative peptidase domain-containing protein [Mycena albidolilacea]
MAPVQLYVYDLSNGLAKQLSAQLTGRQIDGIWHTSIVVFGKEVYYGQGISTSLPGRSHHGQPLQIIDLGETAIDQETWEEYLQEMQEHWTAEKYHLLDFNCNSFTNDAAGFLTGGSIPSFVKDLPTDFLATPFGAALRPTIDNMYRRPTPGEATATPPPPNQPVAASLLQAVAAQAQGQPSTPNPPPAAPLAATQSLASPLHPSTNSASFRTLIRTHRAVVAFFTDFQGCPPCRMIAPVFEQLAAEKGVRVATGGRGAAFTKIDLRIGAGGTLATEWGVRATPTFMFFLDGTKIAEIKGADVSELKTQIDLLLFQAYPPHPHASLSTPTVKALSLEPILFTQVPPLETVLAKFVAFIDAAPHSTTTTQAKEVLRTQVVPYLKARFAPDAAKSTPLPSATPVLLTPWAAATTALVSALSTEALFPLVDMWRLAVLDPAAAAWLAAAPGAGPVGVFSRTARDALAQPTQDKGTRNYVLTALRLLANAFKTPVLARGLLCGGDSDGAVLGTLIPALLHADAAVRTAAASLAFNAAAAVQRARTAAGAGLGGVNATASSGAAGDADAAMCADEEWQVELLSAIVEATEREEGEEVVHRLVAALACLLRFMPTDGQLHGLLEVLGARGVVQGKLQAKSIQKKEVRRLVEEVGSMCP